MGKAKITAYDADTKVYAVEILTDKARLAQRIAAMEATQADLVKRIADTIEKEKTAKAEYIWAKNAFDEAVAIYRANCT